MDYTHVPVVSCIYSEKEINVFCSDSDKNSLITQDILNDEYDKSSLVTPEAHFEYEMILVTGGKASAIINHKTYEVGGKSLIFISRLERHSFVIHERPYCRYVISMSSDLIMSNIKDVELISIFIQRPKEFCNVINLSDEAYDTLLPLFIQMNDEYKYKKAFYETKSIAIIVSMLINLYRTHKNSFPVRGDTNIQAIVLQAQKYVNDNYSRKITLKEISDCNYISRHTLSLAFKDIVGISFKDYLILFRITEAKKLLITTDMSVDEISEEVGYINVNNFVQIFKSKEGVTPLQYRKKFTSQL